MGTMSFKDVFKIFQKNIYNLFYKNVDKKFVNFQLILMVVVLCKEF